MALIKFGQGLYDSYASLTKDQYQVYFTTDTKQIFVGSNEYTKGTKILDAVPTTSTEGNPGTLYAVNNSLYLCQGQESGSWIWTRVANVNDAGGSVTSVDAGDGLETESGSAITTTGTIKHSIPTGATTVVDPTADASPAFGSTFAVQGVATDKFGHVTASNARTITLPTETVLAVSDATGTATALSAGSTFAVVTGVAKGEGSHDLTETTTTFTLPADNDTTYTISSTEEGVVTLTPSTGAASTVQINGWTDLAKKSDITAVLRFKGTKATQSELPTQDVEVGDVWAVSADNSEYVCTATTPDVTWEKLGPVIDLSAYALSDDVIQRVTGEDGEVPKFKSDGTLESTGFTLGCSVPATAVFTDTTYEPATTAVDGLESAADKAKLDGIEAGAEVNIIEVVKAAGTALTVDSTDRSVNVTLSSLGISSGATDIDNAVSAVAWDLF